VVFPQST
jgi:D-lactate dehydrogenase (cytochrome)